MDIPDIRHQRVKDRLLGAIGCDSCLLFDKDTVTFSLLCLLLEESRLHVLHKKFFNRQ